MLDYALAKVLSPFQSSVVNPSSLEKIQPTVLPNKPVVALYYTNWSILNHPEKPPHTLPYDQITNVNYAFFKINKRTGNVTHTDFHTDARLKLFMPYKRDSWFRTIQTLGLLGQFMNVKYARVPELKVMMSVGGWGAKEDFKSLMTEEFKLNNFVKSTLSIIKTFDLDGVDIDWEYPENEKEAEYLVKLLQVLRIQLDKANKKPLFLSFAAPCGDREIIDLLDLKEMDKYLNFWNLMTYDFSGSWSEKVAHHSNLYGDDKTELSCDSIVQHYISQGVTSQKIILGMPNYGRVFSGCNGEIGSKFKGTGCYKEGIVEFNRLPLLNTVEHFDSKLGAAYCYDPIKRYFISYDSNESARWKAKYVKKHELGGGFWWESSGDQNYLKNLEKSNVFQFVEELKRS
ncbi:hypothetical protein PACTADRAFT_2826 [Pachysolen tannophilus NRRL Y-2460]|uniref:chitinase n=1 Tax=Pachysolen tannophilus NRRL Y-2460 TaxID=669874 RepID=A0A1E4TTP6_PACTA|nr:hypothetical protein PACTADRAFT_2826 [Pachysolen tannophilus NRRL Y-2460]